MKLKKIEASPLKLKVRLLVSLMVGLILFASVISIFLRVQDGERKGGAPTTLRQAFLWNEKISKLLTSNKKLSIETQSPPKGKASRFNGSLGLESVLDLKNYAILVQSGKGWLKLPVAAFKLLSKTHHATEFRCIEGWSEDLHYAGAKFSDFVAEYKLGKKNDGSYYNYVGFETPDGKYYVSIDMESMLHEQTLLAWEMNEAPLSVANGAPLRLIIPIKYGIKSLKRIGRIFFSDTRPPDYWAERGYDWYSGL